MSSRGLVVTGRGAPDLPDSRPDPPASPPADSGEAQPRGASSRPAWISSAVRSRIRERMRERCLLLESRCAQGVPATILGTIAPRTSCPQGRLMCPQTRLAFPQVGSPLSTGTVCTVDGTGRRGPAGTRLHGRNDGRDFAAAGAPRVGGCRRGTGARGLLRRWVGRPATPASDVQRPRHDLPADATGVPAQRRADRGR